MRSQMLIALPIQPHEIVSLNSLPPSVLSTQPHLLRTRRTLVISRRLVPRSKLADPTLFDSSLDELDRPVDEEEDAKRERERAVKRFQLLTKTVDPGVGKVYIGLSELEEEEGLLGTGEADELPSISDMTDSKGGEASKRGSGKKVLREPDSREGRALESFYEDERWENEVGSPERGSSVGRWKSVGNGSNLGIKV